MKPNFHLVIVGILVVVFFIMAGISLIAGGDDE